MKSILENIKSAIDTINWKNQTYKDKATELCIYIYNLYVNDGGDFNHYKSLSKEYFIKIIKTKSYLYEIKKSLIDNSILEKNNSYNVKKGQGMGYRFNQNLIKGNYTISNNKSINKSNLYHICGPNDVALCGPNDTLNNNDVALCSPKSYFLNLQTSNNLLFSNLNYLELYHICGPKLETYMNKGFQKLKINEKVYDFINNFKLKRSDIKVNDEITDEHVNLKFENGKYRYSLDNAKKLSIELNKDLILYKQKCYIENENDFIQRKTNELKLILRKSIFEIQNKIFRINRNDTNMRLDYNLTNMKNDLLDYLELDGDKLIELDISNAQFAFLSYLVSDLDNDFINKTQNGDLYDNNKKEWFRIAFDKRKSDQDEWRELYPKTMSFIDSYKDKLGYKSFSNLLQRLESSIMIDGLLNRLIDKFQVFPIHDAIRVKESDLESVKIEIESYFNEINFKCLLRVKNKKTNENIKESEIINYKGLKMVEIEKVSPEDKKSFLVEINRLKDIFGDVSEDMVYELKLFSKEKTWYLYDKWRKKWGYLNVKINE